MQTAASTPFGAPPHFHVADFFPFPQDSGTQIVFNRKRVSNLNLVRREGGRILGVDSVSEADADTADRRADSVSGLDVGE